MCDSIIVLALPFTLSISFATFREYVVVMI